MVDSQLQDQINKRLTLNLLIQGSAQHAFLTCHYLLRDELTELDPELLRLYDQFAVAGFLQYWRGSGVLLLGRPAAFWRRVKRRSHPFHHHALLFKHGAALAKASKRRAIERCKAKGVSTLPCAFSVHLTWLLIRLRICERKEYKSLLESMAKLATQMIWDVPADLLDAELTSAVRFGEIKPAESFKGKFLQSGVAGYGGVERSGSRLLVKAKAWFWPILTHELVKGTAELICLHGLSQMDEEMYTRVVAEADRIEHEPWMLQTGPELWRQLLPLLPDDRTQAHMLMHIARLPPRELESLMFAVLENPQEARERLASLDSK